MKTSKTRMFISAAMLAVSSYSMAASSTLNVVVPFPPGGGSDYVTRLLADKLQTPAEVTVVENRPGANGMLGAEYVARQNNSDSTLLVTTDGVITVNPELYKNNPFDPRKKLTALATVTDSPSVLVVPKASPIHSVRDFVERGHKTELKYASGGVGSAGHLTMAYFADVAGLKMLHVPFKGGSPAMTALMGGYVDGAFVLLASAISQIQQGQLRPLAVSSAHRMPQLPDVPTMEELGYKGFLVSTRHVVMASAKMSKARQRELSDRILKITQDADFQRKMERQGQAVVEDFGPHKTTEWLARISHRKEVHRPS